MNDEKMIISIQWLSSENVASLMRSDEVSSARRLKQRMCEASYES